MALFFKKTSIIKLITFILLGLIIFCALIPVAHAGLWDNITDITNKLTYGTFQMQDMQQLLINIIDIVLTFVTWITLIFMIIGGYLYIAAGGNPDQLERAKKTITGTVIAFILILTSKAIIAFISRGLSQYSTNDNLIGAIHDVINIMLIPIGLAAVLGLIAGGYQYMTSVGNPDQISKAKKTILYSVIGLIAIIISWAIIAFICQNFGLGCPK